MWSIWESGHFHREPHLAVIGGGLTGLFTALFHKRANPAHHVLVLEKGPYPSGASVKNAGFACFGSPSELLADLDAEGADAMLERVEERWKGLLELRSELGNEAIGFEATGGHEVFRPHDPLYTRVAERFDDLNHMLRPIFGEVTYRWSNEGGGPYGLGSDTQVASTRLEGPLDSGALMRTLLGKAISEGVLFRGMAAVNALEERSHDVLLHLADGSHLRAARVVVATNGYTSGLLPDTDVVPARGQVLLTAPITGLRLKGSFHHDEGYFYFRDHAGAVLLGGARNLDPAGETTNAEGTTALIQDRLEQFLREVVLPGTPFSISQRWSGVMGFRAKGKTPLVEQRGQRVVVAAGLCGMGVAIGIRVARKAAGMING